MGKRQRKRSIQKVLGTHCMSEDDARCLETARNGTIWKHTEGNGSQ